MVSVQNHDYCAYAQYITAQYIYRFTCIDTYHAATWYGYQTLPAPPPGPSE